MRHRGNNMNEVLQAVLDYVQMPSTDYAFLITGPWGCGKTYFWKNAVEPEFKKRIGNGESWRPLYVSLYGCRSAQDIDSQIFFASYPHLREMWVKRLTTTGACVFKQIAKHFTGLELPAVNLRWLVNTSQAVLCFDDLERSEMPMREALGYLNTFVEHEAVKAIIRPRCSSGCSFRWCQLARQKVITDVFPHLPRPFWACHPTGCQDSLVYHILLDVSPLLGLEVIDSPVIRWNNVPYKHGLSTVEIDEFAPHQAILCARNGRQVLGYEFLKCFGIPTFGSAVFLASRDNSGGVCLGNSKL